MIVWYIRGPYENLQPMLQSLQAHALFTGPNQQRAVDALEALAWVPNPSLCTIHSIALGMLPLHEAGALLDLAGSALFGGPWRRPDN